MRVTRETLIARNRGLLAIAADARETARAAIQRVEEAVQRSKQIGLARPLARQRPYDPPQDPDLT